MEVAQRRGEKATRGRKGPAEREGRAKRGVRENETQEVN